jgi:hypothetical protein
MEAPDSGGRERQESMLDEEDGGPTVVPEPAV